MSLLNNLFNSLLAIILTFIILFPPLAFGGADTWSILTLELLILLLFFVYILKSAKSGVIKYRKNILNALFVLFVASIIFQISFKTTKIPYQTFFALKLVLLYFALFVVITNNVRHREEIDSIIFKITLVGLLISLLGILQMATGTDKIYWIRNSHSLIFFSTFTYKNHFACYISIAALLTLGSLCVNILKGKEISWGLGPKRILSDIVSNILNRKVFFMLFSFAIMTVALFLSKSKGGILCFLAAVILFISYILSSRKYSKRVILVLFCGLLGIYLLLGLIAIGLGADIRMGEALKEFCSVFSLERYATRISLYTKDAPRIFMEYPFFGIGLGSLYDILPMYLSEVAVHGWGFTEGVLEVAVIPRDVSNDALQLLIEMGLVGLVALLIPFSIFLTRMVTEIGKTSNKYKYLVGMSILCSLLFLGLHTLIDHDMGASAISSLFTVLLSISLLVMNLKPPSKNYLEIEMETKKIITLKTKKAKTIFYVLSTAIFIYLAFIVSKPLIANTLIKNGATLSSFNQALALDPRNDDLYFKYYKFTLSQYKNGYVNKELTYNKAGVAIDKAIKLNPYKTTYLIAKGDFELLGKNYEKACALHKKAALIEPNNPVIQMGYATVIFWQAIHEKDAKRKDTLLKDGLIYYSKARSLSSEKISLRSIIKNTNTLRFLTESLKKEGINIH